MTSRKLLPPIHVHPILLLFIIISILTGTFIDLFIILLIVLFHELGHFAAASYYKWRIRQIMLWVFGGVMDTDEHGNRPVMEEFVVTIAGPFQHIIIYIVIYISTLLSLLPTSIVELVLFYNTTILVFNLLPIWPLDGGKLIFFLLCKGFSFQKAYHISIQSSMIFTVLIIILQLLYFPFTLSALLIMVFLFIENYSEWKKRHFVFMRFLLNRYKGANKIKSVIPIIVPAQYSLMEVFSHFKRDVKHSIYVQLPNNRRLMIDESDCLRSYFYDKNYHKTIEEVASYT